MKKSKNCANIEEYYDTRIILLGLIKHKLDIKPEAYNIYEWLPNLTNTESFALCEFVDNATASYIEHEEELKKEKLIIEINYDDVNKILKIRDNAYGMNLVEFENAILIGSKTNKKNSRNEFGKGLKTAACWFGRKWSVESTQLKSNKLFSACIDIDELVQNKSNSTEISESQIEKNDHYTLITIEKVNRELNTAKIRKQIIFTLGSVYRRDICLGNTEIYFNNKIIEYEELPILVFKKKEMRKNVNIQIQYKNKLYKSKGFIALTSNEKKSSVTDRTGLAFFRRDRAILINQKPYEVVKQPNSVIAWKLFGELDVDDFEVNQAKDGLAWPDELKEKFYKKLIEQIPEIIAVGKLTWDQISEQEGKSSAEKPAKPISNTPEKPSSVSGNEVTYSETTDNSSTVESPGATYGTAENNEYSYSVNNTDYKIKYKSLSSTFLYDFDNENNVLLINMNHRFISSINAESKDSVAKIILSYVLAEEDAINQSGDSGNINPAMIHISLSKTLSKI